MMNRTSEIAGSANTDMMERALGALNYTQQKQAELDREIAKERTLHDEVVRETRKVVRLTALEQRRIHDLEARLLAIERQRGVDLAAAQSSHAAVAEQRNVRQKLEDHVAAERSKALLAQRESCVQIRAVNEWYEMALQCENDPQALAERLAERKEKIASAASAAPSQQFVEIAKCEVEKRLEILMECFSGMCAITAAFGEGVDGVINKAKMEVQESREILASRCPSVDDAVTSPFRPSDIQAYVPSPPCDENMMA